MLNLGNGDTEFPLPSSAARVWSARSKKEKRKMKIDKQIVAMPLPEQGYKFFFLAIVAMTLPKMGEKKGYEICERVKKQKVVMSTIFLQHFHNKSHMISYYQFKKICDKLIVAMALLKLREKKIVRT